MKKLIIALSAFGLIVGSAPALAATQCREQGEVYQVPDEGHAGVYALPRFEGQVRQVWDSRREARLGAGLTASPPNADVQLGSQVDVGRKRLGGWVTHEPNPSAPAAPGFGVPQSFFCAGAPA